MIDGGTLPCSGLDEAADILEGVEAIGYSWQMLRPLRWHIRAARMQRAQGRHARAQWHTWLAERYAEALVTHYCAQVGED